MGADPRNPAAPAESAVLPTALEHPKPSLWHKEKPLLAFVELNQGFVQSWLLLSFFGGSMLVFSLERAAGLQKFLQSEFFPNFCSGSWQSVNLFYIIQHGCSWSFSEEFPRGC